MQDKAASSAAKWSGYAYALLAAGLWGLLGPVSRLCFSGGMEPLEVAFWRAMIGGFCFLIHGLINRQLAVKPLHGLYFCLFGLVGVGLFFSTYQISVRESGAALAVILLYTAPVWVAIFSRAIFKEPITGRKLAALLVALTGTILVCLSGGSLGGGVQPSALGIICGLLAGLFYATHYPFYAWWQDRYNTSTLYTYMLLAGGLVLLPFIHISLDKSLLTWVGILILGLLCTYGAYWAYGRGLRRISPVRAAVVSNLEPVIGTVLAWAWWHENFNSLGWLGVVLVIGAVFLLTLEK